MTDTKQPESHTTLYDVCQEVLRLESVNAELLEALKEIAAPNEFNSDHRVEACREALREIARAAIAKAEVTK